MSETQYQENLHFITSHPEAVARHVTAQDEQIATLRAELETLRAALKKIAKVTYGSDWTWGSEELADYYSMRFFNAQETARAALGEEGK